MSELISVVVPIYNVEKYLTRCLEALLKQTYTNLEIILVDDGSKDGSSAICDEYAEKDSRIKVIHKENGGSSSARNAGIEAATGKYIGFCDSDDYPEPDLYENLYNIFLTYKDVYMAQSMSSDYLEDGTMVKGPYKDSGAVNFISREEMFRMLMLHVGDSSFCTKLIRADYMKQFRFPVGRLNEDLELLLRMNNGIPGVYSWERNGYNIELRDGSNSRNVFRQSFYDAVLVNSNKAFEIMEEQYPQYREETERFCYFQRLDFLLHIPVAEMNKENETYQRTIAEIKKSRKKIKNNQYLTKKEKRNLLILSYVPKLSKRFHGIIMKFKTGRS